MAASVPQIPKIVTFTLATVSYKEDLIDAKIVFVPGPIQQVVTLDGVVHKDVTPGTWQIELNCVQDWDSARPGLAYSLYAGNGTTVAFVYSATGTAESAGSPKFTGSCVLTPIGYGGNGGEFAESTVILPITGTLVLDATP
jgi:hypothetical protein